MLHDPSIAASTPELPPPITATRLTMDHHSVGSMRHHGYGIHRYIHFSPTRSCWKDDSFRLAPFSSSTATRPFAVWLWFCWHVAGSWYRHHIHERHLGSKLRTLSLLHRREVSMVSITWPPKRSATIPVLYVLHRWLLLHPQAHHQSPKGIFGIQCCCIFFSWVGVATISSRVIRPWPMCSLSPLVQPWFCVVPLRLGRMSHGCCSVRVVNGNQVKCLSGQLWQLKDTNTSKLALRL